MPSFDIVAKVELQELRNAVDQVQRELAQRYDFKDSKSSLELKEAEWMIVIVADDKMKLNSVQELLKQRLAKRGVSLKACEFKPPADAGGNTLRQEVAVRQGLNDEQLKKINKLIKETKIKVTSQIQGDQVRVSGKKRDDLQEAIAALRGGIQDADLQFVNFRE